MVTISDWTNKQTNEADGKHNDPVTWRRQKKTTTSGRLAVGKTTHI